MATRKSTQRNRVTDGQMSPYSQAGYSARTIAFLEQKCRLGKASDDLVDADGKAGKGSRNHDDACEAFAFARLTSLTFSPRTIMHTVPSTPTFQLLCSFLT